ncbi:MAG: MOSC domain-containing protein [Flavobacteriales bacterium]|nr:MOSC domain-containing protein [Flavobacteriales bacterium]
MTLALASIHIYPIKSLGGYSVERAQVTPRGLEHDRRWMLIDPNGRFLSQREHGELACLHVSPTTDGMRVVDIRNSDELIIPWGLDHGETLRATIWNDAVDALLAPQEINDWFNERSLPGIRLVYMPDSTVRPTDPNFAIGQTSLSDGFPFLIISQVSLDDLNQRIRSDGHPSQIPMERFRPNLVLEGGEPFQEDDWSTIRIGETRFELVKRCARCVITTTDQRTGRRANEPLRTLATYRKRVTPEGAVKLEFGMNAICLSGKVIQVGDLVTA